MTEQGYKLLLVDDNPTNLTLLQELVQQNLPECGVQVASNGPDALEMASQNPPDGAFIDMQMPGMDGIEVCRRLKQDPRTQGIAVVLITAHQSTPELRADGIDAGAQDFISQPIRNVELLARIRALLRIKAVEKELHSVNQGLRRQVVQKTAALRWVTGLISAGDNVDPQAGSEILQQLAVLLRDDGELDLQRFRGELFARFPDNLRRSLLKLGLLEKVPGVLAEKLADIEDIRSALDYLVRHNFFVTHDADTDQYCFHPNLKAYLGSRADQELGEEEVRQVWLQAADWFLSQGAYATGIVYLLEADALSDAERTVAQIGPLLYGSGGVSRMREQLSALSALDPDQYPWLCCLSGLLHLENDPVQAGGCFERAEQGFATREDRLGRLYCLAQMVHICCKVDVNFVRTREWLALADDLFADQHSGGEDHLLVQVCLYLALGHLVVNCDYQACGIYLEIALAKPVHQQPEYQTMTRLLRGMEQLYRGRWRAAIREFELTSRLLDKSAEVNPSTRLMLIYYRALLLENIGDVLGSRRQKNLARQNASEELFVQCLMQPQLMLLDAQSELAHGHYQQAEEMLGLALTLPGGQHSHLKSQLLQFRALALALLGNCTLAQEFLQEAATLREAVGGPFYLSRLELCGGLVNLVCGQARAALEFFNRTLDCAGQVDDRFLQCSALAFRGLVHYELGSHELATADLRQWDEQMERQEYSNLFGWNPALVVRLVGAAQALGIGARRPLELARSRAYVSFTEDGRQLPLLRFRLLGEFSMAIGGRSIALRQELSSALRQLLGVLLTSPGLELRQEDIQHQFWPDSSADKARSKFDSLLSRLRKALDQLLDGQAARDYLYLQKGTLCLDHSWVDAAEFETLVRRGIRHAKRCEAWQADQAFRRAHRLWRGELNLSMPLDDNREYYRQDLLLLFLESSQIWIDLLVEQRLFAEAAQVGQKALQFDPINELLVRQLYGVHLQGGKVVPANQVLRSYEEALRAEGYDGSEIDEAIAAVVAGGSGN